LVGKALTPDVLAEAGKIALADAKPLAKNAYKVPLTQTLVRRALDRINKI
jgi:CO/xanthine dehydrogenase FAD-binding subunit